MVDEREEVVDISIDSDRSSSSVQDKIYRGWIRKKVGLNVEYMFSYLRELRGNAARGGPKINERLEKEQAWG